MTNDERTLLIEAASEVKQLREELRAHITDAREERSAQLQREVERDRRETMRYAIRTKIILASVTLVGGALGILMDRLLG